MSDAPWQPQKIARSRPPRVVDDFGARPAHRPTPAAPPHRPTSHIQAAVKPAPKPRPTGLSLTDQMLGHTHIKPQSRLASYVQVIVVIIVAVFAGLIFQSLPLGEIAIVAYGIIALVRSIPSRTTFIMALIALGVVPVMMLIGQPFLSDNFAIYAFILLIVAILSVLKEVYRGRKSKGAP